ncbi:MAG TPA: LamG-like jellyroll fold domain-containing protein, partial [Albitalea sp.]
GVRLPAPVRFDGGPAQRLPPEATRRFLDAAGRENAFTVAATVVPADVRQRGPARIVSFSAGPFARNFDLGQDGDRLVFRVRTAVTGANGMNPHVVTARVLAAGRAAQVVASFDGAVARVHVDGRAVGRRHLAAAGCVLPFLCDGDLPLAAALAGALLAVALLGLARPRGRRHAIALAGVAAAAGAALLGLLDVDRGALLHGWGAPLLAAAGAALVAAAVAPHRGVSADAPATPRAA